MLAIVWVMKTKILNTNNMKITLNIGEDAELRAFIKEAIKGQVMSIAREEFVNIFKEELTRKIKGTDSPHFQKMMSDCGTKAIKEILQKDFNVGGWNTEFIKPVVENVVNQAIQGKDWNAMVNQLATEKVRSLIR